MEEYPRSTESQPAPLPRGERPKKGRNPVIIAIAAALVGFVLGYIQGQRQSAPPSLGSMAADPHAGVPGAPPLSSPPQGPPGGQGMSGGGPDLGERLAELERILAADPASYVHLVQMGNLQYDLANWTKAIEYYEKARAIRDDSADVMTDLAVAYREAGKPGKAIELLVRASEMDEEHWQSRYNAAVVHLFDFNDPAAAQRELDKLKTLRAKFPQMPDLGPLEREIARRRR